MESQYKKDLDKLGNALIEARKARGESWYTAVNKYCEMLKKFESKYGRDDWYEAQRLRLMMNPCFHNGQFEEDVVKAIGGGRK